MHTQCFLEMWVFLQVEKIYSKLKTGAFRKLTMTSAMTSGAAEAAFQSSSIYSAFWREHPLILTTGIQKIISLHRENNDAKFISLHFNTDSDFVIKLNSAKI